MKTKFLVYSSKALHFYEDYAIHIPMLNSRVTIPFEKASLKYGVIETDLNELQGLTFDDLSFCHEKSYLDRLRDEPDEVVIETYELRDSEGNFHRYTPALSKKPLSDFIQKALIHVNGTYLASLHALKEGACYHLGGGMHHAMSMRPGGFCMFNDMVISIRKLQKEGLIKKAIIIDMDAHKGDGTAQITSGDDSIETYSIHMKNGWPLGDGACAMSLTPSTLDVGVAPEDNYLEIFESSVSKFLNDFSSADLCIVVHGADVYEHDELESSSLIKLSQEDVLKRDKFIFNKLKILNIPQAWVMAGGYGRRTHEVFWNFLDYFLEKNLK